MTASPAARLEAEPLSLLRDGVSEPFVLLTPAQCDLVIQHLQCGDFPPPMDWLKGRAATDRFFYDVATDPGLIERLTPFLGNDIVLWGVDVLERVPGQIHPWHIDVECAEPGTKFVSIWVGIENISQESALKFVARSQAFPPIQQVMHERGVNSREASDDLVLEVSRQLDPGSYLVQPRMSAGDAILFDGKAWHASNNLRRDGRRLALLFQYAPANVAVRRPESYKWPFRYFATPIPVIAVSGRADRIANRIVPPPPASPAQNAISQIEIRKIEQTPHDGTGGKLRLRYLCTGSTPVLNHMSCHESVLLTEGHPHEFHAHGPETLHVMISGQKQLLRREGERVTADAPLGPNTILFYPPYKPHTSRNPGATAAEYVVFLWDSSPLVGSGDCAAPDFFHASFDPAPKGRKIALDRPTAYLTKLRATSITLEPGESDTPDNAECDVALVLHAGDITVSGAPASARSVIYLPAGKPATIRQHGTQPAHYLQLEFHAPLRTQRTRLVTTASTGSAADAPSSRPQDVRTFWAGPPLSAYEELCLRSFTARGHRVTIYTYDPGLRVPDGVTRADAREIMPSENLFEFRHVTGETSPTVHSNLFRYEMLRRLGGWYVDLDVVLSGENLPETEIYLGSQNPELVNNAVLRFPANAPFLEAATREARLLTGSTQWGASGPYLCTKLAREFGLGGVVRPADIAYPIAVEETRRMFLPAYCEELDYRTCGTDFIHLWNQVWRRARIPKDYGPPEGSFLDLLFRRFGIPVAPGARLSAQAVQTLFDERDFLREAQRMSGGNLASFARQIDATRFERDALLASRSWRISAPLRAGGTLLRRLLGRS